MHSTWLARLILLSVLLINIDPMQVWAAPPLCSPLPHVDGSIRLVSPRIHERLLPNDVEVTIAVLPPGEDVAATQMFSTEAQSGSDRIPLWLSVPRPLSAASPIAGLRKSETAWSFRIFGAPPHSVVSVFAAHYEYGATTNNLSNPFPLPDGAPTDNTANTCRVLVQQRLGTFEIR